MKTSMLSVLEQMQADREATAKRLDGMQAAILAMMGSVAPDTLAAKVPFAIDAGADDDEDEDDDDVSVTSSQLANTADLPPVTAKPLPAGGFALRRSGKGGKGELIVGNRKGKGLAALPLLDSTSRKVSVPGKDRKGNARMEEKTVHLDDYTRNSVGPLMAQQIRTVADTDETVAKGRKRTVRVALVDDNGKVIGNPSTLNLCTSAGGSLMLSGDLAIPVPVTDSLGQTATVEFSQTLYAIGRTFVGVKESASRKRSK